MTLLVGLTFDLRDDYLRRGYGAEETAEFDSIETIEAIEHALVSLDCRTDRIDPPADESAGRRRPVGSCLQHRRGTARVRARIAGPRAPGCVRHSVHVFRPTGPGALAAQRHGQARRSRPWIAHARLRRG